MQIIKETVMNIPLVDLKAQYLALKPEIDDAIHQVLSNTSFVGGPFVKAFEEEFARFCQVKACVGVGNGTDAIFLALKALGIGAGDEVVTVANTFIATSEAISMSGAKPVFVDINPRTYNIDVDLIEAKVNSKTKAIVPVHLYGQPADMAAIRTLADKHGLRIIGDAAQAHGSLYRGTPVAQLSDVATFSFYPGKNLGAYGDAGAVVTDNEELAAKIRMLANHGRTKKYDHDFEGVNSRLDGLQAAILSVKLRHLESWSESRRENANLYNEVLRGCELVTPEELDDVRAVYHLYVVRVKNREKLQQHLKAAGVSTGIHYPIALPYLNAYRHLNHTEADFPHSLKASQEVLSLPMFAELTSDQIEYVADKIREFAC